MVCAGFLVVCSLGVSLHSSHWWVIGFGCFNVATDKVWRQSWIYFCNFDDIIHLSKIRIHSEILACYVLKAGWRRLWCRRLYCRCFASLEDKIAKLACLVISKSYVQRHLGIMLSNTNFNNNIQHAQLYITYRLSWFNFRSAKILSLLRFLRVARFVRYVHEIESVRLLEKFIFPRIFHSLESGFVPKSA